MPPLWYSVSVAAGVRHDSAGHITDSVGIAAINVTAPMGTCRISTVTFSLSCSRSKGRAVDCTCLLCYSDILKRPSRGVSVP